MLEGPASVGSGDTALLMATHTLLEIHLSLLNKCLRRVRSFLVIIWLFTAESWEDPMQREAQRQLRRVGEALSFALICREQEGPM